MFNKKKLLKKAVTLGLLVSTMFCTPVIAADKDEEAVDAENGIVKTVTETENGTTIEGMISMGSTEDGIMPLFLAQGSIYRYPAEGGTWEYGFWYAKVRSYYTVNCNHGSTVQLDGKQSRSINTASGKQSVAELWAVNLPGSVDRYYYRVNK